ncbi:MAG TPA: hypothetical protein VIN61_15920 [Gammaproteobacteria bacterium]
MEIAPGRHEVHAVCMMLPATMAAALRSTNALPAADSGASGTMKPNVRGSQMPPSRGVAPAVSAGDAAGAGLALPEAAGGSSFADGRLAACDAIGANVVRHALRGVAPEIEHRLPRLRESLGVVDRDSVFETTVGQHAQPLGQHHLLRARQARRVEHGDVGQADAPDHERIALPMADRETARQR